MISINKQIYTFIHISTNRAIKVNKHENFFYNLVLLELLVLRELAVVVACFEVVEKVEAGSSGTVVKHCSIFSCGAQEIYDTSLKIMEVTVIAVVIYVAHVPVSIIESSTIRRHLFFK